MNFKLVPEITFESLESTIAAKCPEYKVIIRKNPLLRFRYVQVKKSASVGLWIRIHEKTQKVQFIKAIPSDIVRGLMGGLLLYLFVNGAMNKVRDKVAEVVLENFNTEKI